MRALVYDGPWKIGVQELPDPEPGPADAVVDVIATGICGSDLHGFTGENGRRSPGQVMGHESAARVRTLGSAVQPQPGCGVGDLVTFNPVIGCGHCDACASGATQRCTAKRVIGVDPTIPASMAEQLLLPAANLVALPATLTPALGALVEPLSVGYHAATRAGVEPGQRVLVLGAGPIGQAAALAARRRGAEAVLVSELDPRRRELLTKVGLAGVDPRAGNFASTVAGELGGAPDVVIDSVGSTASMRDALSASSLFASIVLVGMDSPHLEIDAYRVSTEERTLLGSYCYATDEFSSTAAWLAEQGDALLPLIERCVDLDAGADAFASLADGSWPPSKVLICPNGVEGVAP